MGNGEGFEIMPGQSYVRQGGDEPYAVLVWSGIGEVQAITNEAKKPIEIAALTTNDSEFLVTPGTTIRVTNTSKHRTLYLYTVLPISTTESWFVSPEDWKD